MTLDDFVCVVMVVTLIPIAIIPMDGFNRGDY